MPVKKQIIAIGGDAGFDGYHAPDATRCILQTSGLIQPRILFIPTASDEDPQMIGKFNAEMAQVSAPSNVLCLKDNTARDLRSFILEHDLILVGGGKYPIFRTLFLDFRLGVDKRIRVI